MTHAYRGYREWYYTTHGEPPRGWWWRLRAAWLRIWA